MSFEQNVGIDPRLILGWDYRIAKFDKSGCYQPPSQRNRAQIGEGDRCEKRLIIIDMYIMRMPGECAVAMTLAKVS